MFSREIFGIGTVLALVLTVAGRLLAGARIRNICHGTFVNRLVILDGVDLPTRPGEVVVSAWQLGIVLGEEIQPRSIGLAMRSRAAIWWWLPAPHRAVLNGRTR